MKIEVKTVRELIQHLGTQKGIGQRLGVTQAAVGRWGKVGRIRSIYWKELISIGADLGIELTPEDLMEIMLREHRNRGVI